MPLDPVRVEDTREWIAKSRKDLQRAKRLLSESDYDLEDGLFHCQQAAEKALKAFLTWHDRPFAKTHDLRHLSRECAAIDRAFERFIDRLEDVTPYAWVFRYPSDEPQPTLAQANSAAALACEVVEGVLARLPDEVHS